MSRRIWPEGTCKRVRVLSVETVADWDVLVVEAAVGTFAERYAVVGEAGSFSRCSAGEAGQIRLFRGASRDAGRWFYAPEDRPPSEGDGHA